MTKNRNIPADQTETQRLLDLIGEGPYDNLNFVSWLGHKKGAGLLDFLLLVGATMDQLNIVRPSGISDHKFHLQEHHGLTIVEHNGIYKMELL